MKGKKATTAAPSAKATLASLPEEVVEIIVSHLWGDDKAHLAFSCKALLPILSMGHVRLNADEPESRTSLLNATRCLKKQPGGVSHLEVVTAHGGFRGKLSFGTRRVIDLSLLTSLRKLTLNDVAVSLPSLQPVATRLHELDLFNCRLQDSADGFLTKGWTTLTTLSLIHTLVENATMAAELELPALEELDISGFRHQGGVLQPDQLTGSCPNIRGLRFQLDSDVAQDREGRGLCCRLLELGGFADLYMCIGNEHLRVDLDLPASVTLFVIDGLDNATVVDLSWALREAAKCISRGAQLRRLECYPAHACVQGAQWAGSLDEQYRQLGAQLSSLRELEVCGGSQQLLSALCAVVSSAPHLTHANLTITRWPPRKGFPPIRSASLESISVTILEPSKKVPCPLLVLIFLPGCTRLQKVLVQLPCEDLTEGTAVKIRCHRGSPNCIVPLDAHACAAEYRLVHGYDSCVSELGVDFLPEPASLQHVSAYTVLNACHAAGLQQPLKWGHHVVMPGIL